MNKASGFLLVAGLALLGLGLLFFAIERPPIPLAIEPLELRIDAGTMETPGEVVFRLVNESARPARVVGLAEC